MDFLGRILSDDHRRMLPSSNESHEGNPTRAFAESQVETRNGLPLWARNRWTEALGFTEAEVK